MSAPSYIRPSLSLSLSLSFYFLRSPCGAADTHTPTHTHSHTDIGSNEKDLNGLHRFFFKAKSYTLPSPPPCLAPSPVPFLR
ncbi:hypothetical protein F5X96DRAFT_639346 [Biscogniauxia mediterranea]|nr:hypothetical protein F5X96DRAFT_639346 [Biscogniauxia mediterranea]